MAQLSLQKKVVEMFVQKKVAQMTPLTVMMMVMMMVRKNLRRWEARNNMLMVYPKISLMVHLNERLLDARLN